VIRSAVRAWLVAHSALPVGVALVVVAAVGVVIRSVQVPSLTGGALPFPAFFLVPGVVALIASVGLSPRQHAMGGIPRPWRVRVAVVAWLVMLLTACLVAGTPLAMTVPHGDVSAGVAVAVAATVAVAGVSHRIAWVVGAIWIGGMPFVGNRVPDLEPVHHVMRVAPGWTLYAFVGVVLAGWAVLVWSAPRRFAVGTYP